MHHLRVHTKKGSRGVLLIDTLVATALFAIVIVVAVGALTSMIDANKKTRGLRSTVDNVNLALESVGRSIRSGSVYHCGGAPYDTELTCPPSGSTVFAFEGAGGDLGDPDDQVVFRHNDSDKSIERSQDNGGSWERLTGSDVRIEELYFQMSSFGASGEQPKVLISLVAESGPSGRPDQLTRLELQTTVTQRLRYVTSQQEITEGSNNPNNPRCPFEAATGRYFINFEINKANPNVLLSAPSATSPCRTQIGPYTPEGDSIPAGTYNVTLVAFDIHCDDWPTCNDLHDTQEYEHMRIRVGDAVSTNVWSSASEGACTDPNAPAGTITGCTNDIPDTEQENVKIVGENIDIASPITRAWAHHAWSCVGGANPPPSGGVESLVPACAVFDAVGGSEQTSIEIIDF